MISTLFGLHRRVSLRRLSRQLQQWLPLIPTGQQSSRWELYDSADGRLLSVGQILAWESTGAHAQLCLRALHTGRLLDSMPLLDPPPLLAAALPGSRLSTQLQQRLEDQGLQRIGILEVRRLHFDARDGDDKTIARLCAEDYRLLGSKASSAPVTGKQLMLEPLRGYEKTTRQLERRLKADFSLQPAVSHVLEPLLGFLAKPPSKPQKRSKPVVDESIPADIAIRQILLWLLAEMEANEAGVVAGTDSEFLHDFRIAVRTTEAVIKQLRGELGADCNASMVAAFAWLGALTGASRDLDVALFAFAGYRASLPAGQSGGAGSFEDYLRERHGQERETLCAALASTRYHRLKAKWRRFLLRTPGGSAAASELAVVSAGLAAKPISAVIRQRSARLYKKVLRQGEALDAATTGSAFHDLRKTCKKLNYLMTLFAELYAADEVEALLRKLKRLQSNLGKYQDIEMQMMLIGQFHHDGAKPESLPEAERRALERLLEGYRRRQRALRADFPRCLRAIAQDKARKRFRALFQLKSG
ncbi:MAG: CHAD domain-containing protein [Porticoccaceae bacterium]